QGICMPNQLFHKVLHRKRPRLATFVWVAVLGLALSCLATAARAQQPQSQPSDQGQPATQSQDNGKPKQDVPAEAGGPGENVGPYAIPKRKEEAAPPPPPPAVPKKVEGMPDYSLKVNVPLVNVDVLVTTKNGQFIPGLKKD